VTLSSGGSFGFYEVVRLLGAGGMGEVYLARDVRLDREVAIKIIPPEVAEDPERLRRFNREARTASSLNHPNIAHVYEIGEAEGHHYIAMEYVRGEVLSQRIGGKPMRIADVIVFATQIADALDEAHARGVIHRDVKPGNVIISSRGKIKVLDFGLAKMDDERRLDGSPGSTHQADTLIGVVLGTLDYMSHEQVRAQPVDRRTDIFSFGTVLYEMITGRLPFQGASRTDTIYRITQAQTDPVTRYAYDVPPELERIVRKCLEKEPARRYQTVRELLIDLSSLRRDSSLSSVTTIVAGPEPHWWRYTAAAAAGAALVGALVMGVRRFGPVPADVVDSLAVVPVVAADAEPETADLTVGLAASILNSLSDLPNLRLAPRRSSFAGVDAHDPLEVVRRLRFHSALIVEVTRKGDVAQLNIDLQDVEHPDQLWFFTETRKLAEIALAQETISDRVVDALELRFNPEDLKEREAFRLYERGRVLAQRRTEPDIRRAIEFYEQAIAKKPGYALAHAGLAQGYNLLVTYSAIDPQLGNSNARQSAQRALQLDASLAEAHTQLAWVRFRWDWDWIGAESSFTRAVDADPDHSLSRLWYGDLLLALGRHDDGLARLREAQRLDPLNPVARAEITYGLYMSRRYEDALAEGVAAAETHPSHYLPLRYRALALTQLGRGAEAVADLTRALELSGGSSLIKGDLVYAYGKDGRKADALRLFNELLAQRARPNAYVSPFSLAIAAAGLADADRTIEWLQRAFLERANMLVWVNAEPRFDFLRQDPRFAALVNDLRFPKTTIKN
jgi:serine/threonine-protein kinase